MIQGRLEGGTPDEATARLVQRRIADAEIAAERLGLLLLPRAAPSGRTPSPCICRARRVAVGGPAAGAGRGDGAHCAGIWTRCDCWCCGRAAETRGTALAHVRNRLLGYRDEENLPEATPAVQDVFRGIGEAARAVLGLRIALDGPQDESDDSPATARSREELDAEDAAIEAGRGRRRPRRRRPGSGGPRRGPPCRWRWGRRWPSRAVSCCPRQRWYWAVLTCWIVFINTASTGEILVKGYRRLLGTVLGVVAGIGLAGAVGHHTWTAFALVLVCMFAMFYTAPLSYTLMSFFVTAALGLLYTLLNTYSTSVLLLRVEETALGAACGMLTAAVVLPVRTDRRTNELLVDGAGQAGRADVTGGRGPAQRAAARGSGGHGPRAGPGAGRPARRDQPLTHPITPLRSRRDTARYVVALLETCAYHGRALAATAELLPTHPSIAADPRLSGVCSRTSTTSRRSPTTSATRLTVPRWRRARASPRMLEPAPPDPPLRPGHRPGAAPPAAAGRGGVGLARPLGVAVKTPRR